MPNGKPGDHPLTDIVVHGRRVYSARADQLIREIDQLASEAERNGLADLLLGEYNDARHPDVPKLERYLETLRDDLAARARDRGWENR